MKKKDKKQKLPKKFKRLFWCAAICGIGLGTFLQIKYPDVMDAFREFGIINVYLYLTLALLTHIFLHEAAHVIGGVLTGYKVLAIGLFHFQITFLNRRIALKRYSVPGAAGYCIMVPPELKNGTYPFVLTLLGGCLMNFILAILFGSMLFLKGKSFAFYFYCLMMTVFGLISTVTNLIPKAGMGASTDGRKLCAMLKSEKERSAFYTLNKVSEALFHGICLKDMPEEWFSVPSDEDMKNHLLSGIGVNTAARMLEQGRTEEADRLIAHFLSIPSGITDSQRYELTCHRLCAEILGENRPAVIEQLYTDKLTAYMKKAGSTITVMQTQYMYALLVEQSQRKADQVLTKFDKITKRYPFPQNVEACRSLFAKAREKAETEAVNHG